MGMDREVCKELLSRPKLIKSCRAKRRRKSYTAASTICLHGLDRGNFIFETRSWNPTLSTVTKFTVFHFTCRFTAEGRQLLVFLDWYPRVGKQFFCGYDSTSVRNAVGKVLRVLCICVCHQIQAAEAARPQTTANSIKDSRDAATLSQSQLIP
jgi:hypothetical protein